MSAASPVSLSRTFQCPTRTENWPRPAAVILVSGAMALAAFVIGPKRDRAEQAARIGMDAWVEVVNLGGEVLTLPDHGVETYVPPVARPRKSPHEHQQ
jgi:hypothetical protein